MKQRMRYLVLVALAASTTLVGACNDDGDSIGVDNGGSAGASGSKTAGSSAGGSANKAGNNSGGKAGNATAGTSAAGTSAAGTSANAGAGGAGDGGMGGAAENGGASGGDDAGGAAGAGGAGEPALVYKCGSSTLIRKQCSAMAAANCADFPTVCSDCIDSMTSDREGFQLDPPCPVCNAKYDAFAQCEVDAFEAGDLAFGVECVDGWGADGTANCYPFYEEAAACQGYVGSDVDPMACPATWPPQ